MNLNLNETWRELYGAGKVRWMQGMKRADGIRTLDVQDGLALWASRNNDRGWYVLRHWDVPDFADPATRGCLLEQARELWSDPGLAVVGEFDPPFAPSWRVMGQSHHGDRFQQLAMIGHDSELAAILAAIQAAPPKVTE
jgi:hypothetical protein